MVPKSNAALSYHGKFYIRSGSTTQELKSGALQKLLLKANNLSWDEVGVDNADYNDIDNEREHDSYPRNPLIADIFFRAGYIEAWGRGTLTIINEATRNGLSKPAFSVRQGGLEVAFQRDSALRPEKEAPKLAFKPSPRQQKAMDYAKENGRISNAIYQELTGVSKRTASRDLENLVQNLVFEKAGTSHKYTTYSLAGRF